MIRMLTIASALLMTACYTSGGNAVPQGPQPGQGQYIYPQYQRPIPTQYTPQADLCRSQLYLGLRGQHIGGISVGLIPGDKRIIKPAELETDQDDFLADMNPRPPFLEVTELLAGQPLYAASVRTGVYRGQLGPDRENRLTMELDEYGYVQTVECR